MHALLLMMALVSVAADAGPSGFAVSWLRITT